MTILLPRPAAFSGLQRCESNNDQVASELGTVVTASGSTHTKGAWATLIAASAYDSYGILIEFYNSAVASTNTSQLCDIGLGAASSERVVIDNLLCGNVGTSIGAQNAGNAYFFPLFIPAGSRVAARIQAAIASDTVSVKVTLFQWPMAGVPVLSRVTTYGANTGDSGGTAHTPGTGSWPTPTQITASTTWPVKYLQLGLSKGADTTGANTRGIARVTKGAGNEVLVSDLTWMESTTLESVLFALANFKLSHMRFDIPAASRLAVAARQSTAEAHDFVLYAGD